MVKAAVFASFAAAIVSASPLMARNLSSVAPTATAVPSFTTSYGSSVTSAPSVSTWSTYSAQPTSMGTMPGLDPFTRAASPNPSVAPDLVAKLITANSAATRDTIIAAEDPTHGVFDFNPLANPGVTPGLGGQVDVANRANFPILTGLGISAAALFFKPCGLAPPHIHPRATEFFTLTTDSTITTGFIGEVGASTQQNTTLTQYQGTVFPQGSIHFLQNQGCAPAVGISALSNEDPGASFVAQGFFLNVEPDVIDATLGFPQQIDADNFAQFKNNIPAPFVLGVESCLQRCGIKY